MAFTSRGSMIRPFIAAAFACLLIGNPAHAAASGADVTVKSQTDTLKTVEAKVTIDAPPEAVWRIVTNYGNLKNIMPGYDKSTVVSEAGNSATVDIATKAAGLVPSFSYRVKVNENKAAQAINIQRVSGDFNAISATYRLQPLNAGNKTLLTYSLKIDVGNKVPKLGLNHVLKGNTAAGMEAMQAYCHKQFKRSMTASASK